MPLSNYKYGGLRWVTISTISDNCNDNFLLSITVIYLLTLYHKYGGEFYAQSFHSKDMTIRILTIFHYHK